MTFGLGVWYHTIVSCIIFECIPYIVLFPSIAFSRNLLELGFSQSEETAPMLAILLSTTSTNISSTTTIIISCTFPNATMGFDWDLVDTANSEIKSYFECSICLQLVDMDGLITNACSHCFCRNCLETWLSRASNHKTCPNCKTDLLPDVEPGPTAGPLVLNGQAVLAKPLHKANGLLSRMLKGIQVQCPVKNCTWQGAYGDSAAHIHNRSIHPSLAAPLLVPCQPSQEYPSCVTVSGAGTLQVNGLYVYKCTFKGFPFYQMAGQWMEREVVFAVHIQTMKTGNLRWFISIMETPQAKARESSFYRATREAVVPLLPPLSGWLCGQNGEIGVEPAPTLALTW